MRLAILTDIHGNATALEAVLADAVERGVDGFACLGDIVGYGPDPGECTDRMMALVAEGALCVQGNHDEGIATPDPALGGLAKAALDWTRPLLNDAQREFLANLPLTARLGDALLVHASADEPGDWTYVTSDLRAIGSFRACDARLILCGHVHQPALMSRDRTGVVREVAIPMRAPVPLLSSRRWLAVVGSVGQPRDGNPAAGYAIYDNEAPSLTFLRVPYDVAETVRRIRAAGLPEALATRLMNGD